MSPKRLEYVIWLGTEDRYRHLHFREKDRIVLFRVQYETLVRGTWLPVVRYDSAHGYAHRDLFDRHGRAAKTPLFVQDLNDALTFAESDLKANWVKYKKAFLEQP